MTIKVGIVGECMIEMVNQHQNQFQMGFAGDCFNFAVYLKKNSPDTEVKFISALGDDLYSQQMREIWREQGIDDELTLTLPDQLPGLYMINTDSQGEREFFYYRSRSAAKQMFDDEAGEQLLTQLDQFDYLFFSGITLAILNEAGRTRFLEKLKQLTQCQIIFDSNYRRRLWPDEETAKKVMEACLPYVNIGMPSFSDEQALYGDLNSAAVVKRWQRAGVEEVVVKNGADDVVLAVGEQWDTVKIEHAKRVIDTTAAGDSFNGAYMARRIAGDKPAKAAEFAAAVAEEVIGFKGAFA